MFLGLLLLLQSFGLIFLICFINQKSIAAVRIFSLVLTIISFFISLCLWYVYDTSIFALQHYWYISDLFQFGVDGLSLSFIILTTIVFPSCILAAWTVTLSVKELHIYLLVIELLLVAVFSILDLFGFYIVFELILLPMLAIIGVWGARARKIKAAYYFFMYTLMGSLLMLVGLILVYFETGTTNYLALLMVPFSEEKQILLWALFFFAFAVKIPMFPFHIWLPEAHVEAPTLGSVILAALLLKLGSYGFLRVLIPMFPVGTIFFKPLVVTLALSGVVYASLTLLRQIDIKRIIAYSSVAHMNFGVLGVFSDTVEGLEGGLLLMLSHGFSSGALFLAAGMLYDRFHTRLLHYYGGLVKLMPVFTVVFFCLTLANFGFPGTANFAGEFLILLGILKMESIVILGGALVGFMLSLVYSMLLYNRLLFGELNLGYLKYSAVLDLTRREFCVFIPLLLPIVIIGVYPIMITDLVRFSYGLIG
jgi:proton-translocating NADH-quinone oxidoreductase chain M